jgi:predicted AlkP superfamily phosphohydrolase/phosphomutase
MVEATELKERIARWAVDRVDPHVFAMVFSETDHASHRWWVEGDPPRELIDVYDLVDRTMGRLVTDLVRDDDVVLVVSDHGSWPIHHFVHIAPLLAEGGFLARSGGSLGVSRGTSSFDRVKMGRGVGNRDKRQTRLFARMDWANTKAFPLGDHVVVTGVYVNGPAFPIPAVGPDEYEDVRAKVVSLLSEVEDPMAGGPALATVAPREEVYRGPAIALAPDLVVDGVPGIGLHLGRVLDFHQTTSEIKLGGHRRDGIYAVNAPFALDHREPIQGLLPKVLRAMSLDPAPTQDVASEGYSAQQAEAIEDHLRGLGYME